LITQLLRYIKQSFFLNSNVALDAKSERHQSQKTSIGKKSQKIAKNQDQENLRLKLTLAEKNRSD
jgi:hypothetical protein